MKAQLEGCGAVWAVEDCRGNMHLPKDQNEAKALVATKNFQHISRNGDEYWHIREKTFHIPIQTEYNQNAIAIIKAKVGEKTWENPQTIEKGRALSSIVSEIKERFGDKVAFVTDNWQEYAKIRLLTPENLQKLSTVNIDTKAEHSVYSLHQGIAIRNNITQKNEYLMLTPELANNEKFHTNLRNAISEHFTERSLNENKELRSRKDIATPCK